MRYLVTGHTILYTSETYEVISVEKSLEMLHKLKVVGLDTETHGLDPYTKELVSLQMGNYEFQVFVDTTTTNIQYYKEFLESDRLFLLHNAKFDLRFLYHQRIVPKKVYDTYLAEKILWQGYPPGYRGMGLADIAMDYLGVYLNKSLRGKRGLGEDVVGYGCEDVRYLEKIRDIQLKQLTNKESLVALDVENEFVKVLAYTEYSGIKLDPDKWTDKMLQDNNELEKAEKALNDWVIKQAETDYFFKQYITVNTQGDLWAGFNTTPVCIINWNSSAQLVPVFEYLGFDLTVKDKKTGIYKKSVEAKVLELQKNISDITPLYLDYSSKFKIVSTYGENVLKQINPITGRIHTNFNQLMDTGRLSCGGKDRITKVEHINLQNLPSDEITRACFVAEEGNLLIDCDYTAQEDLVFTELSREPKLIAFYNDTKRKRDGHSFVAKICFPKELVEVEEEEVKHKRPDLRALAKKAKFSIHYGGNGTTIARTLSLPIEEGIAIEKSYLSGFTEIDKYFRRVKRDMWEKGYILISAITGHKMFIPDWEDLKEIEKSFTNTFWNEYREIKRIDPSHYTVKKVRSFFQAKSGYERNALNAPVQGTSAAITKIAGIKYFNHLVEEQLLFKVWITNIVHDEYLIEVPSSYADYEASQLQKCMEDAGAIFCKVVKLKAIPEIAPYWKH